MTGRHPRSSPQRTRSVAALSRSRAIGAERPRARDDYDPQQGGHPVRIVAYAAHPLGVMLDLLIFRPRHWVGSLPGVDKLFGHERYTD
jgi:hypothetical protein